MRSWAELRVPAEIDTQEPILFYIPIAHTYIYEYRCENDSCELWLRFGFACGAQSKQTSLALATSPSIDSGCWSSGRSRRRCQILRQDSAARSRHEQLYICITSVQLQRSDSDSQVREKLLTKVDFRFSNPFSPPARTASLCNFAIISIFLFLFFIPDICIPTNILRPAPRKGKIGEYSARAMELGCGKSIVVHSRGGLDSRAQGRGFTFWVVLGGSGWSWWRLRNKFSSLSSI